MTSSNFVQPISPKPKDFSLTVLNNKKSKFLDLKSWNQQMFVIFAWKMTEIKHIYHFLNFFCWIDAALPQIKHISVIWLDGGDETQDFPQVRC